MLDLYKYQNAIKFAGEAHANQKVPGTEANYLLHLSNVAIEVIAAHNEFPNFDLNTAIQLALLHDTLEDTKITFNELEEHFGLKVGEGVKALTKDTSISNKYDRMINSLQRIKSSFKEVAIVKICDRIINLQKPPAHWSSTKIANYKEEAKLIAKELKGYHEYLDARISEKIAYYNK